MKILTTLLVGSHFVPPAKVLLEHLPTGCRLELEPEPENPYDELAIVVYLAGRDIPTSQHADLELKLPGMGMTLEEVVALERIPLGHVASSEGKPIRQAKEKGMDYSGTIEFHEGIDEGGGLVTLGFNEEGKPIVHFSFGSSE